MRPLGLLPLALLAVFAGGAPAQADGTGHIHVKGEAGVQVLLDGDFKGRTNADVGGFVIEDVPEGLHLLRAVKAGYAPQEARVRVYEGRVAIYTLKAFVTKSAPKKAEKAAAKKPKEPPLKAGKGKVWVTSEPERCTIEIPSAGFQKVEKTGKWMRLNNAEPGAHVAKFSALGKSVHCEFRLRRGEVAYIVVDFKEGKAEVDERVALSSPAPTGAPSKETTDALSTPGGAFPHRIVAKPPKSGDRFRMHKALERALAWLAAHQSDTGAWEAADFNLWCNGAIVDEIERHPDGKGKAIYDEGITGLALLAFLGAGHGPKGEQLYAQAVARGLEHLQSIQDEEGCFGHRKTAQYIYNHAICALAMIEAYGMTGDVDLWRSAQHALYFIHMARNPWLVWRYGVSPGDNDTSVTGWMMRAIRSAEVVNEHVAAQGKPTPFEVDETAWNGIRFWIKKVSDPDYGFTGYVRRQAGPARPQGLVKAFPGEHSESLTAIGGLARIYLGADPKKSKLVKLGADVCAKQSPTWNRITGAIDMYYWYYGTMFMYQVGGRHWDVWRRAFIRQVLEHQRKDGGPCGYHGSWDPLGPWGADGGRVYSTAMIALCLEAYTRYPRRKVKRAP